MSDIDDCRKSVERLIRDRGEVMRAGNDKIEEIRERHAQSDKNYIELESTWDIHADRATLLAEVDRLRVEIKRHREALKPFAALSLWPDDIGDEWTVNDIRSGYDWDETENDTKTDDVFIKRGHIRAARKALEGKP